MADQCQHAISAIGGRAQQCPRQSDTTATVLAADQPAAEQMALCLEHATQLGARKEGSIYRPGQSQPVRIFTR